MGHSVPGKSKLFSSFPPHKTKTLWSFGLSSSYFSNQDIPLNFVHSCTTRANLEVFLQKHLYPEFRREEGALRWRKDWKKSSASNLSLCFLRTHRRTGTRRAGWRSSAEKQIQTQHTVTSWTVAPYTRRTQFMLMRFHFSLGCGSREAAPFLWLLLYVLFLSPCCYLPLQLIWTL